MNRSRPAARKTASPNAAIRMPTATPSVGTIRRVSTSTSTLASPRHTSTSLSSTRPSVGMKIANTKRSHGAQSSSASSRGITTKSTSFSSISNTLSMIRSVSNNIDATRVNAMAVAASAPIMTRQRRGMSSTPTQGNIGDVIGFPLADIGEGITEVEVLQWFVKPGDKIEQFQKVCEVQSDKANVEITSRYDGVVESLEYDVGTMAKVGQPLIKIKLSTATANAPAKKTDVDESSSKKVTATPAADAASTESAILSSPKANNNVLASPVVRRMASEFGIELGRVRATGKMGQITKDDLLKYQQEISQKGAPACAMAAAAAAATATSASSSPAPSSQPAAAEVKKPIVAIPQRSTSGVEDTIVNVTGIQRVMVKTMTAAASIPTFGYSDEICVDNLVALRKQLVDKASTHGVKLSYFAFIIKALSLALTKYPQVNAHANDDCSTITQKGAHNIGLAMDTPRGLLVPNIKNVQDKSILQIAAELNRLQSLGAAGKLSTDDLKGGTITLSNIGTIGGTYCTPILVVPEVAIGALGKFYQKAAFKPDGTVYPSTVFNIGWTADHRALDGATVARFSNEMKNYIENPQEMLLY